MTPTDYEDFAGELLETTPQCDPTESICLFGRQTRPRRDNDGADDTPRGYPEIDLSDKKWREHTLKGKQEIPAGYTYFGQLIGHDLGRSLRIEHVPHSEKRVQLGADSSRPPLRYNVIENPLTLETIYGSGPAMLQHLFDPQTLLFRVDEGFVISKVHDPSDPSIRALYDNRNRDTIILHRLATIWMRYHNKIATQVMADLKTRDQVSRPQKERAYALARAHVLKTWHHLIVNDFLPRFVDPEVMQMSFLEMRRFEVLDETSLLHGLFRAFHCLPRRKYSFPETHFLSEILLKSQSDNEMPAAGWNIDWELFFTDQGEGTKTGMCASFSHRMTRSDGVPISSLDLSTAQETDPLQLNGPAIKRIINKMDPNWSRRLDPGHLAQTFTKDVAAELGRAITENEVLQSPLFVVLMLEAQLYGEKGRFGPLGSILLRCSIEHSIANVRTNMLAGSGSIGDVPDTLMQLINRI